jgi:hypothetical protein
MPYFIIRPAVLKSKIGLIFLLFSTYLILFMRTGIGTDRSRFISDIYVESEGDLATLFIFLFSLVLIFTGRTVVNKKVLVVCFTTLALLIINFLLTPLASFKWLLNWCGFLVIFLYFSNLIINLDRRSAHLLQQYSVHVFTLTALVFSIWISPIWFESYEYLLLNMSLTNSQTLAQFTADLGILKQHLAYFCALIFISGFIFWPQLPRISKLIFIIILALLIPIIISSRSLLFGMMLTVFWHYVSKNNIRLLISLITSLVLLLLLFSVIGLDYILYDYANNRIIGMMLAWDLVSDSIFGIGNGGYHVYVLSHPELASIYPDSGGFPVAPESDVTYYLASWGVLSGFFIVFYWFILIRGASILHFSKKILPIERVYIYMSWILIFMGLGEDNAGSLIWFIFMALGFGVIIRHRTKLLAMSRS